MKRPYLPLVIALLVAAVMFGGTRMRLISGCPGEYCVDSGEFQVALALDGTVHHTGYPLFMMLGTPFVWGLATTGVAPAEGAAWYSLVWALAAVAAVWWAARIMLDDPWIALLPALVIAVIPVFWIHAVIPEVYSLHFAFSALVVALTLRLKRAWSSRWAWLLAAVVGLAVAHHRLAAPTVATAALVLTPAWWRARDRWRWLIVATGLALAGFLPYIDIPLRALGGSIWIYGQPTTWDGLWFIASGREAADFGQMQPFQGGLLGALGVAAGGVRDQAGWPVLVVAAVGAVSGWRAGGAARRDVLVILAFAVVGLIFAAAYWAVLPVPVIVYPALLAAALLVGAAFQHLRTWSARLTPAAARGLALSAATLWTSWRGTSLWPEMSAMTGNDSNARFARSAETELVAPDGSILMAPFGGRFAALAYAKYVDHALADRRLVDHRSDFGTLAADGGRIYTSAETPYTLGLDWWRERLGPDVSVESAGPGWISIGRRETSDATDGVSLGDGVVVAAVNVVPGADGAALTVTVQWAAEAQPGRDYSTVVFGSDQVLTAITAPDQIVAQSDSKAPVYGWYPTTLWRPGERVREDHVLAWPADRILRTLVVGAYVQEADGSFTTLGRSAWHLVAGVWSPASERTP